MATVRKLGGRVLTIPDPWEWGAPEFKSIAGFRVMFRGQPLPSVSPGWIFEPVPPQHLSAVAAALTRANRFVMDNCQGFFKEIGRGDPYHAVRRSVTVHAGPLGRRHRGVSGFHALVGDNHRISIGTQIVSNLDIAAATVIHELCHAAGVSGRFLGQSTRTSHYRAYQSERECTEHAGGPPRALLDWSLPRFQRRLGRPVTREQIAGEFWHQMEWRGDCAACSPLDPNSPEQQGP